MGQHTAHHISHYSKHGHVKEIREGAKATHKFKIHIVCIAVAGCITLILLHFHIGNDITTSFGPLAPSGVQEMMDMLRKL